MIRRKSGVVTKIKMKIFWMLLALAVGVARGWGCDLVSEGKVLCEVTSDEPPRDVSLPEGTSKVEVSCLNDEDASAALSAISKRAASVLESLEVEGCSLLAPLDAQVPVRRLRLSSTSFDGELLSHFPLVEAVNLSGNALRMRDLGEDLLCQAGPVGLQVNIICKNNFKFNFNI